MISDAWNSVDASTNQNYWNKYGFHIDLARNEESLVNIELEE